MLGYGISRRTVERDLLALAATYDIVEAAVNGTDRSEWWIPGLGVRRSGYRMRRCHRRLAGWNQESNQIVHTC